MNSETNSQITLNKKKQKTFFQKLLGRNYKWFYLVKYLIKSNLIYFWSEVFVSINRTITLLGTIIIFLYLGKTNEPILNYLLLGSIFFAITDPVLSWFVSGNIKSGSLTKWLMYPMKHTTFLFFVAVANCLYMAVTYLVSLIPVVLLFHQNITLTGNFGLILLFVPIAFVTRFSLQILTGFTAFWFVEGTGSNHLMQNLENSLSGSMFPLYILPNYFTFLQFTPFAFTFYHPMQIYLGKYSTIQILYVFLGGIFWSVSLYFLAKLVFKMGLKRNESVGL
jgi:ABC-2 type transport system permease protein